MWHKKVAAAAAVAYVLGVGGMAESAAPVVVSNKPLSVSVTSGNKTPYTVSSNVKSSKAAMVKTTKSEDKKAKKSKKNKKEQQVAEKKSAESKKISVNKSTVFANIELPENYKDISIYGDSVATKGQAVAVIKHYNPDVQLACSVEELVDLYWQEAEREGVRPDLALAQALVETGFFRYGGDVHHNQNNFCGLGTTGNGVKGASFKTPEIGVRAHIQHLLAYTQKKRPSTKIVDPRYELAHNIRLERGVVDTWYGLNGTWAMGSNYCEKIMVNYQRMLAMQAEDAEDTVREEKQEAKKTADKKNNPHRMRDLVEKILHGDE